MIPFNIVFFFEGMRIDCGRPCWSGEVRLTEGLADCRNDGLV